MKEFMINLMLIAVVIVITLSIITDILVLKGQRDLDTRITEVNETIDRLHPYQKTRQQIKMKGHDITVYDD